MQPFYVQPPANLFPGHHAAYPLVNQSFDLLHQCFELSTLSRGIADILVCDSFRSKLGLTHTGKHIETTLN